MYAVNLSPAFSKGTYRVTVYWGKGNNQTFQELLDTNSYLFSRDPKHHCGLLVVGCGGQVMNGILAPVHLTVGPVGPQTHPVAISLVPQCIIGIGRLRWHNPSKGILVGKSKWNPLGLSLSRNIVNRKQHCILGGIAEISAIIRDLKDAGVVVSNTSSFNLPIWPVQKTNESWRMTLDFRKFN